MSHTESGFGDQIWVDVDRSKHVVLLRVNGGETIKLYAEKATHLQGRLGDAVLALGCLQMLGMPEEVKADV